MKKQIKLYNVIFPIWLLLIFPQTWLVAIPANFVIDLAVIIITMRLLKMNNIKLHAKKSILKVVIFGFLSDIIGGIFMVIPNFIQPLMPTVISRWIYEHILTAAMFDPLSSIWGFLYVLACAAISAVCIYFFNSKFSFNKTDISLSEKKKISLSLAIVTAPYLFFIPYNTFNF